MNHVHCEVHLDFKHIGKAKKSAYYRKYMLDCICEIILQIGWNCFVVYQGSTAKPDETTIFVSTLQTTPGHSFPDSTTSQSYPAQKHCPSNETIYPNNNNNNTVMVSFPKTLAGYSNTSTTKCGRHIEAI